MMHIFLFLTALAVIRGDQILFPEDVPPAPVEFSNPRRFTPLAYSPQAASVPAYPSDERPRFSGGVRPVKTAASAQRTNEQAYWTNRPNTRFVPEADKRPVFSGGRPRESTGPPMPTSEQTYWKNHVNHVLASSVLRFATDLDYAINVNQGPPQTVDRENVVFSPLNIAGTLAVVLLGSAGKTFDEIVQILRLEVGIDVSSQSEIVHQMFGFLLNSPENSPKVPGAPEIFSAGGIFVQDGYPIRSQFKSIAEGVYKYDIFNMDFARNSRATRDFINNWVDKQTRGMIKSLLDDDPDYSTKVILGSALYFAAQWKQPFFISRTEREPFYLTSGKKITVDMMYGGGRYPFYEDWDLGVKILGLPYRTRTDEELPSFESLDEGTTMFLVMPTKGDLESLKRYLTPNTIENLISKMNSSFNVIAMPRMKLSSSLSLNQAFKTLGIRSLFTPGEANLAMMSSGNQSTSPPFIGPRVNDEEGPSRNAYGDNDFSDKIGYFRYEDDVADYDVQQWKNGFQLNKLRRTRSTRAKRQARPVDPNFQRFIQSQGYPSYGLDDLRNSGQLDNPGLYASDVIHKVEIDLEETGTVAAAATSVTLQRSAPQNRFIADHPFIFFIRHNPSRLVLFWGTVNKPTPNYP